MNLEDCETIVRAFYKQRNIAHVVESGAMLRQNGNPYHIEPDETYLDGNSVYVIEYEYGPKRPVESITKYWWLLHRTRWLEEGVKLKCALFLLSSKPGPLRLDTCALLGDELALKHPAAFEFACLMPSEVSEQSLNSTLKSLL